MHSRFGNPHPAGGHMMVQQQQQQMVPQNQAAGSVIPLPNGLVMLPNGNIVTPQQAQALMSGAMQGMQMVPNNMNMQMVPMQPGMGMMPMQGMMMQPAGGIEPNPLFAGR